jgi:hypothetical protein
MKLNPPASSSDLDAARAIARRLHRRALGHERATDRPREVADLEAEFTPSADAVSREESAPPAAESVPGFSPTEPSPAEPPSPAESPLAEPPPAEPPSPAEPPPADAPPAEPPPPPAETSPVEPEPVPPAVPSFELPEAEPPGDAALETSLPEPGTTESTPVEETTPRDMETLSDEVAPPDLPEDGEEPAGPASLESLTSEAPEESPLPEALDAQATPAEGVTTPPGIAPDSALGDLGADDEGGAVLEGLEPPPGGGSPGDLLEDAAPGWPEGNPLEDQIETEPEPERAPDDLVAPQPPSWDEVTDSCLALARAHAAMVVDPSGQVLAARGDWPEPGPEAIGGRLVSMMEKTLHDAPTRSVSAPLAGRHLTAWRIPASEGYYTIVFMGEAPLGADVRSPVDLEIKQALGQ